MRGGAEELGEEAGFECRRSSREPAAATLASADVLANSSRREAAARTAISEFRRLLDE